ncbi:MAG TPA: substrate-binding domain-containing protein [Terracidiphilus sp.]|nr:substrate-binding domain-containing protein [Terracidiphilus sp.]
MHFVGRPTCLLLALLGLALSGCASSSWRSTIAVIPRETSEEISVAEHGGAADAALRQHLRVYWNGPTTSDDVEPQIKLTEKAIRDRSYGLLLSPNNPFALNTLIERALSSAIPVVVVGAEIPIAPRQGLSFVLNDENRTGTLIARRLHRILGGKGKVIILGVNPLSPGSVPRAEAVQRAILREDPQIQIVDELTGSFSFGRAELVTEQAIRSHPGLDAIIALGINETRGAASAVASAGAMGRIRIVGCDQGMDLLFLLRDSVIDSLVVQDSRTMGRIAVGNLVAQHLGRSVPERVLVEPRFVSQANVDDPVIQTILSERWRPGT